MCRRSLLAIVAIAGCVVLGCENLAQSPATTTQPQFEVASVKRSTPVGPPPSLENSGRRYGRYSYRRLPLKVCLQIAYHLPPYRISAPAWTDTERYDIEATMPPTTTDDQVLLMFQHLLVERFRIKLHWQEKVTSAYVLVVDKKGPKFRRSEDQKRAQEIRMELNGFEARNTPMENLAGILTRFTDRPVVDSTGLTGVYDFTLRWAADREEMSAALASGKTVPAMQAMRGDDPGAPLRALLSLGLKAEPRKLPLKFLVIDEAQKIPIEN